MPSRSIAALFTLLLAASPAAAQQGGWDPTGVQHTRDELTEMLRRFEATAASSAYSGSIRDQARDEAELIRSRLEEGDLQVGDRIELTVEGQPDLSNTFTVVAGRLLVLPALGEVPLEGVLRSELQPYLTEYVARYIREPVVHARSLIRLEVRGAVAQQGFYAVPSDVPLTDALMMAGGPTALADVEKIRIERGTEVIWTDENLRAAIQQGRTLDQLSMRAGDGIIVPAQQATFDFVRNGLLILSGIGTILLIAERAF